MELDSEYFNRLVQFISQRDNVTYKIDDLTDEHDKMIAHLAYYIENKTPDMIEILFIHPQTEGGDITHFRVFEFFDWVIWKEKRENPRTPVVYPKTEIPRLKETQIITLKPKATTQVTVQTPTLF